MNDKKYTIGEISKLCGITPRQLRYYDKADILKPCYRNPDNGYRYYTEEQIELLVFLSDLKNIGITNDSIQRLFVNRDVGQLVQELQINLAMVEQEINIALNRYRSLVNALVMNTKALSYLNGDEAICSGYNQFWISVIQFPKIDILYKCYDIEWGSEDSVNYLQHVVGLTHLSMEKNIRTTGNRYTIFHHGAQSQFCAPEQSVEGVLEVARELAEEIPPNGSGFVRTLGGFSSISTVYCGNISQKKHAYDELYKWADDHNLSISDTAIEEYLVDSFTSANRQRFVTKIYLPLEGSKV